MPGRFRLLADVSPLRESPAFRRLWTGTTLSTVGGGLTRFAIPLQVYDITRSSLAVGLTGLFTLMPTLVIGLFGGALADARDRRRVVLVTSSSLAVISGAFTVLAFARLGQAWPLYLLAAAQAGLMAVDQPARSTFIAGLLPASRVQAAVTLNRVSFQIAFIVGPALGGLITAAPHLGLKGCYLIDAVSFGAALYGVGRLPAMPPEQPGGSRSLRAVREGLAFVRRSQPLAGAFLADLAFTVFGQPTSLFPAINAERFAADPRTLGLLAACVGVGGLAGSVLSGPLRRIRRPGLAMLGCVAVSGIGFAVFAIAHSLWLTLLPLAVVGAADGFTVVFRGTIAQMVTPGGLRGRVMAADFVVAAGGSQLGSLESGALASLTSPVISAFSGGVACLGAAVVLAVGLPGLVCYRLSGD
jgi:MFS family permease